MHSHRFWEATAFFDTPRIALTIILTHTNLQEAKGVPKVKLWVRIAISLSLSQRSLLCRSRKILSSESSPHFHFFLQLFFSTFLLYFHSSGVSKSLRLIETWGKISTCTARRYLKRRTHQHHSNNAGTRWRSRKFFLSFPSLTSFNIEQIINYRDEMVLEA